MSGTAKLHTRMRRLPREGGIQCVVLVYLLALTSGAPTTPPPGENFTYAFHSNTKSESVPGGCLFNDKFYRVGTAWHPELDPLGTYYCVNCTCKESHDGTGNLSCINLEDDCPQLKCHHQYSRKEKCCPQCLEGCLFNDKFYPVGTTWHPVLDPLGKYYCIDCICKESSDDGTGIVHCANLEDDCPQLNCRYQYLPKEQCCRQCLKGDDLSPPPDVIIYDPANTLLFRGEFLALLTGSQGDPPVRTFAAGFGYFIVTLSTVHYSLQFHEIGEITGIDIMSDDQTVAYSVPINIHDHRICGVWSDVDKPWLDLLLDEKLHIVVRTKKFPGGELFSDIFYKENEWIDSYTSLLKPQSKFYNFGTIGIAGGGGLGMFKLYPSQQELRFVVTIDGISEVSGAYFYTHINIGNDTKHSSHQRILYDFSSSYKAQVQTFVGVWPSLTDTELGWLARGLLHVTVYGRSPGQELRGQLVVATTCSGLSAVLSGDQPPLEVYTGAGASGLFELTKDGSLNFEINWIGLEGKLTSIGFYEPLHGTDSQELRLIHNITDIISEKNTEVMAGGIWNKLSAAQLALLTDGLLHVTICTDLYKDGEVTGQIQRLLFNSHQKLKKELFVTLTGSQVIPFQYSGVAGQVWFSHDCYCSLHYRISIQGLSVTDYVKTAHIRGPAPEGWVGSIIYDIIESFSRNLAVGVIKYPDSHFYNLLHQGFLYLEVGTRLTKIRGQLRLQTECRKSTYESIRPKEAVELKNCTFERNEYKHGEMWHPPAIGSLTVDYCINCHCKDGGVLCLLLNEHCPDILCQNPLKIEGICCPICDDDISGSSSDYSDVSSSSGTGTGTGMLAFPSSVPESSTEASTLPYDARPAYTAPPGCPSPDLPVAVECEVNGHSIEVGSRWHPYLTQYGLIQCITCQCLKGDDTHAEVKCNSLPCPPLECNDTIFLNDRDCCPSCRMENFANSTEAPSTQTPSTQTPTPAGCQLGGSQYNDGEEFIPYVPLIGPLLCVRCNCTNGVVNCDWPCPALDCDHPIKQPGECCRICPDTSLPEGT